MQLTITPTQQIVTLDGVPTRLWEGRTAEGGRIDVYVHCVSPKDDQGATEFEAAAAAGLIQETATPHEIHAMETTRP